MNSIAVWWKEEENVKVHLDVNIWHTKESKSNYLEFGLKIGNYKSLECINIYVPYDISKGDIEDKVEILASNNALTNAMFNEKLRTTRSDGSLHTVEFLDDNKKNFVYCKLNIDDDIEIESDRTIKLKINGRNYDNEIKKSYYRFRINKLEKIFTELKENYFWIDGFFKTIGFIEININSVRKLPKKIVNHLDNITFDSMNLFVMTDNFTSFIFQSEDVNKSRILENHIWDKYLSKENAKDINKIIAYHWKKQNFKDYNLFVKIFYITKEYVANWSNGNINITIRCGR
jgi:hypothetical protein